MANTEELETAIAEAAQSARVSVTSYESLAKEASEQLTGDDAADSGVWLKLTAKAYAQAAGDTAKAWTGGLHLLQILAADDSPVDDE